MRPEEVDLFLKTYNDEEKCHLAGKYTNYSSMEIAEYFDDKPVYRFTYDSNELQTIFKQKKALPDYYNMAVIKQDRFEEVPMHKHEWIELCYVYSGKCQLTIMNERTLLKEGEMVLIGSGTPHGIDRCDEEDILVNFVISRDYLNAAFFQRLNKDSVLTSLLVDALDNQTIEKRYIFFHASPGHRLASFVRLFLCEFYDPSVTSSHILDSLMNLIICELINLFEQEGERDASHANNLFAILRYIELNCASCTLEETATHFGMHPNYFTAYLKKHTGSSYKQLVHLQRLQQAAYLLRSTTLNTNDICYHIGYQNTGFFFKKFEEQFGCTPQEYRKQSHL